MRSPDGSVTTANVRPASLLRHNLPLAAKTRFGFAGSNAMLFIELRRYSLTSVQLPPPLAVRYRPRGVATMAICVLVGCIASAVLAPASGPVMVQVFTPAIAADTHAMAGRQLSLARIPGRMDFRVFSSWAESRQMLPHPRAPIRRNFRRELGG